MSLCRTPASPVYSKAKPVANANCNSQFLVPDFQVQNVSGVTDVNILAGVQIGVTDQSTPSIPEFIIDWIPHITLTAILDADAFRSAVEHVIPVLWGVVIDQIDLSWVYNKAIASQTLINDGGLTPPTLTAGALTHQYTGLVLSNTDIKFTLDGDDGLALPGSTAQSIFTIKYGNYSCWGVGPRKDQGGISLAAMQTFLEGLFTTGTKDLVTTRVKNPLTGEGVVLERFYYFYPQRFGFATFLQNGIPGGFVRLKNAGGTIQVATFDQIDGDENDLLIDNGEEAEAYYVYMSGSDNIVGAIFEVQ